MCCYTRTHKHVYIYMYTYVCVCVRNFFYELILFIHLIVLRYTFHTYICLFFNIYNLINKYVFFSAVDLFSFWFPFPVIQIQENIFSNLIFNFIQYFIIIYMFVCFFSMFIWMCVLFLFYLSFFNVNSVKNVTSFHLEFVLFLFVCVFWGICLFLLMLLLFFVNPIL